MVEVFISRIGFDSTSETFVVILKEKKGERVLPIWIGRYEAESIVMKIHNIKHARPLTHDLCGNIIAGLGGSLRRVQITHIDNATYYGELHVDVGNVMKIVDARPSDSIAIALRLEAPIFADESLLGDAAEEEELNATDVAEPAKGEGPRLTADQLKSYLEKLRPEDFGDFKP